jgi:hypothetical protein
MQRGAELQQTAQDQEPAIRNKAEKKKGPRRVSEGEGAKGKEGKGTKVSRYEGVR